ncbi:MAG: hypothetical protein N2654_07095 [Deltaproteobacteria bacterium]|nr:hypothetical protein [Deltaproteobacteria bacterium]
MEKRENSTELRANEFCGLVLDQGNQKLLTQIKEEVFSQILKKDLTLLFKDWDYQTLALTDLGNHLSRLSDLAEFGYFISPQSYQSRFKGWLGKVFTQVKWFIFKKIFYRILHPYLDKDYQFKITLIQVLESIKGRSR